MLREGRVSPGSGAESRMGRRVALGFIVAGTVIWPAIAQVPEPKPVVPPDLDAKIEEAHRSSNRGADARRAAAILAVAARVAASAPPVPDPAPDGTAGAEPAAADDPPPLAETGAAAADTASGAAAAGTTADDSAGRPPLPQAPPAAAAGADRDEGSPPPETAANDTGDGAPPPPDAAPSPPAEAGGGADGQEVPPVPVMRASVVPAPVKGGPAGDAEPADLSDGTADDVDFGIPRAKPKVTHVAAAARTSTLSRPSTQSNVQSSIRAAQLDPGDGPACEAALKSRAAFALAEAVRDKSCGAPRPLAVSTVEGVGLSTTATLRCPVATALADWTRNVVKPAAKKHFRQDIAAYMLGPTYACRTRRNGSRTSRLSEHAFANAVDIAGFKLKDGTVFMVEPHHTGAKKAFQAEVRSGACGTFKTVLGPRTTPMHDDHLHLDSAPRRNGSVYCR